MNTIIDQNLGAIEKALRWASNVPEAEQLQFKKELIDIRRELKKVKYAWKSTARLLHLVKVKWVSLTL